MKTRILTLSILVAVLILFPALAAGNDAARTPLTFVEDVRDVGFADPTLATVSSDGSNVYVTSWHSDSLTAFARDPSTGKLTWMEVHRDSPTEDGLAGAQGVAVSLDGTHVYVASYWDNAVTVFSRNPTTGALTWQEVHKDSPSEDGLNGARSVAVSLDGKNVYVAGEDDNAVAVFSRNISTGALTWLEMHQSPSEAGLNHAYSVAVSPDGGHIYVASSEDDAVTVFARNTSDGKLTWRETHLGEDGLDGAHSVAVSPDGAHVYVASFVDDAVAAFTRNTTTGRLTWLEVHRDSTSEDGLNGACTVTLDPGGKNVYVLGSWEGAAAVFARNTSTGRLTWLEAHKDGVGGVDGLNLAQGLAVSPGAGSHVYVTGQLDSAVAVFGRDGATGRLAFAQVYKSPPGLNGVVGMAVSPDGNHVYATGNDDDAIVIFERNKASGALNYMRQIADSASTDGLDGARAVALDTDGENVYVAGNADDAVAVFYRYPGDGALTYLEMQKDGAGADGLDGPQDLVVSPDGKHLYVASQGEDAVAIFGRKAPNGTLEYAGVVRDNTGPINGLDGAYALAITADGKYLYVAGYDDDAVAFFERDATSGALTFKHAYLNVACPIPDGLLGASDLALSPDDAYLYVAARNGDAVTFYERDQTTGDLTWVDTIDYFEDALDGARAIAVSPDGTQVYVASQVAHALAVFARDQATGGLTLVTVHQDGVNGVDGLNTAGGLAVSPEGGHVYVSGYGDDAVAIFARWHVYLPLALRNY